MVKLYTFDNDFRSIKFFQKLLYIDPNYQRANEVHLRLGLMYKVFHEWETALKHLKHAYSDVSLSTFSKLESMIVYFNVSKHFIQYIFCFQ